MSLDNEIFRTDDVLRPLALLHGAIVGDWMGKRSLALLRRQLHAIDSDVSGQGVRDNPGGESKRRPGWSAVSLA